MKNEDKYTQYALERARKVGNEFVGSLQEQLVVNNTTAPPYNA
ncbi:MAG: hypothetical protein ACYSQY_01055 [Planctomycetota bacterium]|jgi:hypothetical protein